MKKIRQPRSKPTRFELELLHLLWKRDGATVRELHEELRQAREIGYTSVLKTLQIMTEKGLVEREEADKAHLYRAARTEKQTKKQLVSDLSERLFSGSAAQLALHALSTHTIKADELRLIRELIERKERES
jgi:BlaI family penicillinase repressor